MRALLLSLLLPQPYPSIFFFFNDTATTEIYTLSLHDALPISEGPIERERRRSTRVRLRCRVSMESGNRSEEHTSELQSQSNLVCRLLLEKKKKMTAMTRLVGFIPS